MKSLIFYRLPLLVLLNLLTLPSPQAQALIECDALGKCNILSGIDSPGRDKLGNLLEDIIDVFDAPELAWAREQDRPPVDIVADLTESLQSCLSKTLAIRKFLLPECGNGKAPSRLQTVNHIQEIWSPKRDTLMSSYLREHTGDATTELKQPRFVVAHWTDSPTAASAINHFKYLYRTDSGRSVVGRADKVNVSCHFVVERSGVIHQLLPEDKIARHTIGLNREAFCIENVGNDDLNASSKYALTEEQVRANATIVEYLRSRHPSIEALIGHFEYRNFENTYIFQDRKKHRTGKEDPGPHFMAKLREELGSRCR